MSLIKTIWNGLDSRLDKQQYFKWFNYLAVIILVGEALLNAAIIKRVPYTEIDWVAYMQEVEGVVNGTWDYTKLKGDTGPLVYPGGFVAIYWILYTITGKGADIALAQWIFAALYVLTAFFVLKIYKHSRALPLWAVGLICVSRRVHSIFVLRLFNDCFAMMFLFLAMYLFIKDHWSLGCFFYSVAVSVKMNVLLFAPGLAVLLVKRFGIFPSIPKLLICAYLQIVVAIPFVMENPIGYLKMSFDLGRKFIFYWSVNWKFIPEEIFLSDGWGLGLLALTLTFIVIFALFKWTQQEGISKLLFSSWTQPPMFNKQRGILLSAEHIATVMFTSNFVGIVFSRSLHFQFYSWYWFSLPYLLWTTSLPSVVRVILLGAIELIWNIFPSNPMSSAGLFICHLILLYFLVVAPTKPAYTISGSGSANQKQAPAVLKKKKDQ